MLNSAFLQLKLFIKLKTFNHFYYFEIDFDTKLILSYEIREYIYPNLICDEIILFFPLLIIHKSDKILMVLI